MKQILSVVLLAALATGCATTSEPMAAYVPAGTVHEVALTYSEPTPVLSPAFSFIPTRIRQIECRTAAAARAIDDAVVPVYEQYDHPGTDRGWLTAALADVIGNAMIDEREAGNCRMRTGE